MNAPRQHVDFSVGLLYLLLGCGSAGVAYGYGLGTPARMGAGFFPFWLGIGLGLLGLGAILRAGSRQRPAQRLEPWAWKPLGWVLGALGLFALLLPTAGLVIASAVLVLVSSRASAQFNWAASLANAAAISLFSALVFVAGLGLPMPLWPTFIG
ncbi:tripartite tricarboxylate transporter TctB family protein [Pseudomonas typographi]|uniref:Tripartite tricarboxylate transporter TctB family protein n=1 Tax=Pseudomonas typographi TaxID=2715964 RepID=A0ABR7YWW5_9PSED|nr:tripartite tricarboxylate transporter TctB family protein [Pseudomonas typographi]MBD1552603.1 tripartite tricarboxylate transporter TctB family protein [Pseudomonas typographi]MBD1586184.1 tripartite tricarboxylate transporter TctB family protein [Pseudomonas typographi]MBD1597655.1 tripartite tricarboxylate transporter TctB family protein [Pseudomonas typographi]